MKKSFSSVGTAYLTLALCLLFCAHLYSQAPQSMNYQAVARNVAGNVIPNQTVGLRFSIHDATPGGVTVYQETNTLSTNNFGLVTALIGAGTVQSGTFSAIDWSTGNKFLQVEMDATGGSNFADMGTTQLMSVPYALLSQISADNLWLSNGLDISNKNNGNVGIGTTSPTAKLSISFNGYDANSGIAITNTRAGGKTLTINQGTLGKLNFTEPDVVDLMTMDFNNHAIGINNTTPVNTLDVSGNTPRTGSFINTNNTTDDYYGVFASCNQIAGWGYGVRGSGGKYGVSGQSVRPGTGNRTGVEGFAQGDNATNNVTGVSGIASSGTTGYGVYGNSMSATINWAGYFNGNVYANGTYQGSDRKLKNNIQPMREALSIIDKLNPCSYTFKTEAYKQMNLPEGLQYGLIADEVERVLPGAVKEAVQPAEYERRDDMKDQKLSEEVHFSAVNYTEMIPILIAGMKEQQKTISELRNELELLKKTFASKQKR